MRTQLWSRLIALGLLLTAAATWAWAHAGHESLPAQGMTVNVAEGLVLLSPPAQAALGIETAEVRQEPMDEKLAAPATVIAPWQRNAHATALLGGKVAAIHAQMGDWVKAGQVLADVASLDLENLQLELRAAQNDQNVAALNLRELEAADAQGAVSRQGLLDARSKLREGENAVEIARRKLQALGVEPALIGNLLADPKATPLKTLSIRSPIAGVVSHAEARVGQVVEPTDHLFGILDARQVSAQIDVLEKDLARVEVGQPVTIRWDLGRSDGKAPAARSEAVVSGKGLALDSKTHAAVVWVELSNAAAEGSESARLHLYPGMVGLAEIRLTASKPVLTVPAAALLEQGAERFVLVEEGPGQYVRHNVVVGRRSDGRVEIRDGQVVPGDRVVTFGAHELATPFAPQVLRLSPEAAQAAGVRWEPAARRSIAKTVSLPGQVELPPDRRAIGAARLAGVVHSIHVRPDQQVQAGDLVAEIVSLELLNLETELFRSQLQLELLEQTLAQLRPLADQGNPAISRRHYRELQGNEVAVRQRRDSLERKLGALGLSVSQIRDIRRQLVATLPLRAPIAGAVVRFNATLGQAVKADDPVFEIHDGTHPVVRGFVADRQRDAVRVGQPVRVRLAADPGTVLSGTIVRSAQSFEADRTLSVWAELDSPGGVRSPLLHGMEARLTSLAGETPPVLAVPLGAIARDGGRSFVFVRRADGSFERRGVETGRSDDLITEIVSGLREGEPIAVAGIAALETTLASIR